MGNTTNLPTHRPKPNRRPPAYTGARNYHSNRGSSKVFFPTEDPGSCRQEATQSREESNLPRKDFNLSHPGDYRRRISLRPAPPLTIREKQNPPDPETPHLHISELKEFHRFQKRHQPSTADNNLTKQPVIISTDNTHKKFTPLQVAQYNSMEVPNQLAIDNLIDQLVTSDEEQRIAGDVKLQVGMMFQTLRRLDQDNAALRRAGGGGGGRDAMGDIATLQEEIANYQGQVKGLEDKNNELYKVNHEWSEEYKNMRKSLTDQIKKLEEEKDALERQIAKLDAELNEDDTASNQLIKKLKQANGLLAQEKQLAEQHSEGLESERNKLAKRLNTLEKLYEEDVNEELAAKEQIRDLAITVREMKDKEKKHINEYRLLDDRVTDLQEQLRKAKNQHKTEKDNREKAEKELKKANRAFKEIKKEIFEQLSKEHYSPPISSKERKKVPKYPPRYGFGPSELAAEKKLSKRLASLAPWDEDFSVLEDCIPSKEGYTYSETSEDEFY